MAFATIEQGIEVYKGKLREYKRWSEYSSKQDPAKRAVNQKIWDVRFRDMQDVLDLTPEEITKYKQEVDETFHELESLF